MPRRMSGRSFDSDYSTHSSEEYKFRRRVFRAEDRLKKCVKSFMWLGYALKLSGKIDLWDMIRGVDIEGSSFLYNEPYEVGKHEGGTRIIIAPKDELKYVQKRINTLLLRSFSRHPNTFGYMGGGCGEVAERHAPWESTLMFDVRDAFFQVPWTSVRNEIRGYGFRQESEGFSGSIAYWIAKLCVYTPVPKMIQDRFFGIRSFLPQGAPTSPACFHLACRPLDEKYARIAHRVGGIVSRYADNYFFSMPTPAVSSKLERILVGEAEKRGFPIHKIRRVNQGELCRVLGYNINQGRVTNTRDFNRRFRGALHVLQTRLERGLEWEDTYDRVRGFMGMAKNVPPRLQLEYEECMNKIVRL